MKTTTTFRKSEFKSQAERENIKFSYDLMDCLIYYKAMAYRWEDSADPEIEDAEYFFNEKEAIEYADSINLSIGYMATVDKMYIRYNSFNECYEFGQEFDFNEIYKNSESDTIYAGSTNEGDEIEGAIVVRWNWEKYIGYARNFEGLRYAYCDETDNSIDTGNLERTFRSNESVLLTAEEIDGLEGQDLLDRINEELSLTHYKWNYFQKHPTDDKIINDLDINIESNVEDGEE